jgi:hypothetical protein
VTSCSQRRNTLRTWRFPKRLMLFSGSQTS